VQGPEFRKRVLDGEGNIIMTEFDQIWPDLRVLARSSPTDKYTLVTGILQSQAVQKLLTNLVLLVLSKKKQCTC
jgi:Ca2+ transporting ATPase